MEKEEEMTNPLTGETMTVRLTFVDEVLGTTPSDPELHERFVASKAPDAATREEEIAAEGVDDYLDRSMTIFPHDSEDRPIFYDYQIRGFMKSAAAACREIDGCVTKGLRAYKKEIDRWVFVEPREIPIETGDVGVCQRPLRAQTAQGERVSLVSSERILPGATITFTVRCLKPDDMDMVREWLDYGSLCGLGQWRNSGKGRFTWEEL